MTTPRDSRLTDLPTSCPHCGQPLRYVTRTASNELVYSCLHDGWFRYGPERVLERLRPEQAG